MNTKAFLSEYFPIFPFLWEAAMRRRVRVCMVNMLVETIKSLQLFIHHCLLANVTYRTWLDWKGACECACKFGTYIGVSLRTQPCRWLAQLLVGILYFLSFIDLFNSAAVGKNEYREGICAYRLESRRPCMAIELVMTDRGDVYIGQKKSFQDYWIILLYSC